MLDVPEINAIATRAATAALRKVAGVQDVSTREIVDSYGNDALSITIVLRRGTGDRVKGQHALDTLVSVHDALRSAREDRFPVLRYVTEEELERADDPES